MAQINNIPNAPNVLLSATAGEVRTGRFERLYIGDTGNTEVPIEFHMSTALFPLYRGYVACVQIKDPSSRRDFIPMHRVTRTGEFTSYPTINGRGEMMHIPVVLRDYRVSGGVGNRIMRVIVQGIPMLPANTTGESPLSYHDKAEEFEVAYSPQGTNSGNGHGAGNASPHPVDYDA